jgi:hypothetical protein
MNVDTGLEQHLLSTRHQITPEADWRLFETSGHDGYERIDTASSRGWSPVPSWGSDGWDLGSWPLVVIFHRQSADGFELAYNVEGSVTVYQYPTRELRDAATDCLAFWHWKYDGAKWVDGIDAVDDAPDHLRGQFSWERLSTVTTAG